MLSGAYLIEGYMKFKLSPVAYQIDWLLIQWTRTLPGNNYYQNTDSVLDSQKQSATRQAVNLFL